MKIPKALLLIPIFISVTSLATDEGAFGLSEENTVTARKTLMNVKAALNDAVRTVRDVIYPNLQTYDVNPYTGTGILYDFIGSTSNNTARLSTSIISQFSGYKSNAYISRLAIVESGLRIQMKFISLNDTLPQDMNYNVPMFEAFYGRRIMLVPILNIKYDSTNKITVRDQEINLWECLTDADESISSMGTTIAEGMRSVVSMVGGILGTCQYISSTSMNTVWKNI